MTVLKAINIDLTPDELIKVWLEVQSQNKDKIGIFPYSQPLTTNFRKLFENNDLTGYEEKSFSTFIEIKLEFLKKSLHLARGFEIFLAELNKHLEQVCVDEIVKFMGTKTFNIEDFPNILYIDIFDTNIEAIVTNDICRLGQLYKYRIFIAKE